MIELRVKALWINLWSDPAGDNDQISCLVPRKKKWFVRYLPAMNM
jgi:hypothetical protein